MKLFPASKVDDYCLHYPSPTELSSFNLKQVQTPKELLNFAHSALAFLEKNSIHQNPYFVGGGLVSDLFTKFSHHYNIPPSTENEDIRFDPLRIEQAIHFVTGLNSTQDISAYMKLVEEVCDSPKLLEIVRLLVRKHDYWYDGYSEAYLNWTYFLVPFLKFYLDKNVEFQALLGQKPLENNILKEHLKKLESLLSSNSSSSQRTSPETEGESDISRKLKELRDAIPAEEKSKNKFYLLGHWAFCFHLNQLLNKKDTTFLQLCLLALRYLPKIKQLSEVEGLPTHSVFDLEKVNFQFNSFKPVLLSLCQRLESENLPPEEKIQLFQVLDNLVTVAVQEKGTPFEFLFQAAENSDTVLVRVLKIIQQNESLLEKEHNFALGVSFNFYEYLIGLFCDLIDKVDKSLKEQANERKQFAKLVYNNFIKGDIQDAKLKPFIKRKYYAVALEISFRDPEFTEIILENYNFSKKKLEFLITSEAAIDCLDLEVNLQLTLQFFNRKFEKNEPDEEEGKKRFLEIYKLFLAHIADPKVDITRLKIIGMFLFHGLLWKVQHLDAIRNEFFTAVVTFLTKKCQLDIWDVLGIQRNLWILVHKSLDWKRILVEEPIYELLDIIQDRTADTAKSAGTVLALEEFCRVPEVQARLFKMVMSSFEKAKEALSKLDTSPMFDENTVNESRRIFRKIVFFIVPWAEGLAKSFSFISSEQNFESFSKIVKEIIPLFYHRAFPFYLFNSEKDFLRQRFLGILQFNARSRWATQLCFCESFNEISQLKFKAFNSKSPEEKTKEKNALLNLIKRVIGRIRPLALDDQTLPQQEALILSTDLFSLVYGTSKINIWTPWQGKCCLTETQQAGLIEGVKTLLQWFEDYLIDFCCALENEYATGAEKDAVDSLCFLFYLVELDFNNLIKSMALLETTHPLIIKFYSNLLQRSLTSQSKTLYGELLRVISVNLQNLTNEKLKPAILCSFFLEISFWQNLWGKVTQLLNERKLNAKALDIQTGQGTNFSGLCIFVTFIKTEFENGKLAEFAKSTPEVQKTLRVFFDEIFGPFSGLVRKVISFQVLLLNDGKVNELIQNFLKIYEIVYGQKQDMIALDIKKCEENLATEDAEKKKEEEKKIEELKKEMEETREKFAKEVEFYGVFYSFTELMKTEAERFTPCIQSSLQKALRAIHARNYHKIQELNPQVLTDNNITWENEAPSNEFIIEEAADKSLSKEISVLHDHVAMAFDLLSRENSCKQLEESFIWCFYQHATLLLEKLQAPNCPEISNKELLNTVFDLANKVSELLINYFASSQLPKKTNGKQCEFVFTWIKLLMKIRNLALNLFDPISVILTSIVKLLKVVLLSDKSSAVTFLLQDQSLIHDLLCVNTTESWTIETTMEIASLFDLVIEDSLPVELKTEMLVKEDLLPLEEDSKRVIEIESLSFFENYPNKGKIAEILSQKFIISPCENSFAPDKIHIAIDPSKETSLESQLSKVLGSIPAETINTVNALINAFIENYLYNLSQLATIEQSTSVKKGPLRNTSGVLTILSTLHENHKDLTTYIGFHKNNFTNVVEPFLPQISLLSDLQKDSFQSLTFFECLFKLKYFTFHSAYPFLFICQEYTGVTFVQNNDPSTILDISYLMMNQFISLYTKTFKEMTESQQNSKVITPTYYLSFWQATQCLISARYLQFKPQEKYQSYFKSGILLLLREVLCAMKILAKSYQDILAIDEGFFNDFLSEFLSYVYENELAACSETKKSIQEMKCDHYNSFLENSDLESKIATFDNLTNMIQEQQTENKIASSGSLGANHIQKSKNEVWLPFLMGEKVSKKKSWQEVQEEELKRIQSLLNLHLKNTECKTEDEREKSMTRLLQNLESFGANRKLDLKDLFGFSYEKQSMISIPTLVSAKREEEPEAEVQKLSVLLSKKFQDKGVNEQEEKKEKAEGAESVSEEKKEAEKKESENKAQEEEKVEEPKLEKEKSKEASKDKQIVYFFHESLNSRRDLEFIKKDTISRLKGIHERVLVALMHSEQQSYENVKKESVSLEVHSELGKLSDFEGHILLCLLDKFELLKDFEHPLRKEIKEEYDWIHKNFAEYRQILKALRGEDFEEEEQNDEEGVEATEFIFSEDFAYCSNPPDNTIKNPQESDQPKISEFKQTTSLISELYLIDDEVVESFIHYLCIEHKTGLDLKESKIASLIRKLCRSPRFEAKFIDFCFFFLYCSEHLKDQELVESLGFYSHFQGSEFNPVNVYHTIAFNILSFLKYYLVKKDPILYAARVHIEKYGLKKIEKLRAVYKYPKKTHSLVSVCDLLVGLLCVKEVTTVPKLFEVLEKILVTFFAEGKHLKVKEVKDGDVQITGSRILTSLSCVRLVEMNKVDQIVKKFPEVAVYGVKGVTKFLGETIEILNLLLDESNKKLKPKIQEENYDLTNEDLAQIVDNLSLFTQFQDALTPFSLSISKWFLKRTSHDESLHNQEAEKGPAYYRAIKMFDSSILSEKLTEDFILHLFEFINYLSKSQNNSQPPISQLIHLIVGVSLRIYTIICIRDTFKKAEAAQNNQDNQGEVDFPLLTSLVSTESQIEHIEVPELKQTFSSLRASRQFDWDILFSNLIKNHRDALTHVAYEDTNRSVPRPEVLVISKRRPWILDFSSKKKILSDSIIRDWIQLGVGTSCRTISIERAQLLKTTLEAFTALELRSLRRKIKIEFVGEEGSDAGGLTREYFTVIIRELFDTKKGLFSLSANGVGVQPSSLSTIIPSHLKLIELAGIMVAKAIQHDCVVDTELTKPLLKHILRRKMNLNDLEELDPELTKSLRWMSDNSVEGLEQSFTYETNVFGRTETRELIPNGETTIVNDENKKEFIQTLCEMKTRQEMKNQIDAFLKGFNLIIPFEFLSLFTVSELQLLISGVPTIDVAEMKKYAKYVGYDANSPQIIWLWEIFSEFSQKELAAFVFFTSGSLKLSPSSMEHRPFKYRKAGFGPDQLPISHTCSWEIEIPPYESKEQMRQKLLLAIFEGQESFMMN